ncbi:alpha-ketoacid dehydrogenase subunit beta [Baekduia soli]|uniref:Alpha-ketoacid dehydrogenase subunit beta n=1 Tax=Baekduia soli TaxID=496014 RepID=A0A5B8U989_9ACTN|nr:pyruvate dehydrogenase complex E1 component subunit beta [Baekduia soli]QEC49723.1 alpha-ketoacid dehydrogenase subunit beta [Baekduia soli]
MSAKYWQAINKALHGEMERDPTVVIFGQNVAESGGTFGSTRGLLETFGPDRVRDTPISELASVGAAVGAATMGLRPVIEIVFSDFLLIAADQLVNQAAKLRYFTGGATRVPLVVKTGVGIDGGLGGQHSNSFEALWAHIPGLKVVWPSTPADADGLLRAAIRDPDPVIFFESVGRYAARGPDPTGEPVPIGLARTVTEGDDVTLVTYGTAVDAVAEAAAALAEEGVSAEVLDLRTIQPWDAGTVMESVRRTGRAIVVHDAVRSFGVGAEVAAEISERCFDRLAAPVLRLGAHRVPSPQVRQLEAEILPRAREVVDAARALVRHPARP